MILVEHANAIVRDAFGEFGEHIHVLTSFQREGLVIIDLALRANPNCKIVTIDTGRLPVATLKMMELVESHFGIPVDRIQPDAAEVEAMTSLHGMDLFRESVANRMLCCEVRKVRPLKRLESGAKAVFVGLRRGQAQSRAEVPVFERGAGLVRVSPLAEWSAEDVLQYTKDRGLPEHPLYAANYRTIGCEPCTRAVLAGEHERAGRWWWEDEADKECGLHFSADGRAMRKVDFLLSELLNQVTAK